MQNLNFGNQSKQRIREFTGHFFKGQRIYVGDLVEYFRGDFKDIGEVRKEDSTYLVRDKPLVPVR
jgi:hypothetical protein